MVTKVSSQYEELEASPGVSAVSLRRRVIGLVVGILLNFSFGLNDYFWAPFVPQMHEERGLSKTDTGIISCGLGFGEIVMASSLIFILPRTNNRKALFCLGPFITGTNTILFGQLNSLLSEHHNSVYSVLTTLTRVLQGVGVAFTFCSGTPLLLTFFPDMTGKLCSWISIAPPIGQLAGPPIGSVLFGLGGYLLPFWVVGLFQVILSLVGLILIPEAKNINSKNKRRNDIDTNFFKRYLQNGGVILLSISAIFVFSAGSFFAVTFSLEMLDRYNIQSSESGIYAFPIVLGRTLFSPLFGYLVDKGYPNLLFTVVGCFSTAFGYVLLYLAKFVDLFESLFVFEGAFFLIGCTSSAAFVSFIPINRLIFSSAKGDCNSSVDSLAASAMYICFGSSIIIGMGVFGGVVNDELGFENTCLFLACCCSVVGILISIYFFKIVNSNNSLNQNERQFEADIDDTNAETPLMDSVD